MTAETPAMPAPPQPTAEHERLVEHAGTWNVHCSFYMDPSQPPMEVDGKETVEMFGPFWTTSLFEAEMFGAPYQGRATLGYEPHTGQYVSTWIDTMSPSFFKLTGTFNQDGTVLEMTGEGMDCMSQEMTLYRTTEERIGPDERRFEMFQQTPQGEMKIFTHHYKRAR
jgi:hypothetical protein